MLLEKLRIFFRVQRAPSLHTIKHASIMERQQYQDIANTSTTTTTTTTGCLRRKGTKRLRRSVPSDKGSSCFPARRTIAAALCGLLATPSAGEVRSVSRVYHSACLERGQSYWDYDNFRLSSLDWEDGERYEVTGRLGFGRFGEVLEGVAADDGHQVVLKVLKPARSFKVKREIRALQVLGGANNVLALEGVCRNRNTGTMTLVLEHIGDGVQWLGHNARNLRGATAGIAVADAATAAQLPKSGVRTLTPPPPGVEVDQAGPEATVSSFGQGRATSWTSGTGSANTVGSADGAGVCAEGSAGAGPASTGGTSVGSAGSAGASVSGGGGGGGGGVSASGATNEDGSIVGCTTTTGGVEDTAWRRNDRPGEGGGWRGGRGGGATRSCENRPEVDETENGNNTDGGYGGSGGGDGGGGGVGGGGEAVGVESGRLSDYEVRLYMYKLLRALDFAHSRGLMHRDVKPRNVVINRRTRNLRLIDWGLCDFYIPGRRNMARVGSRFYKAPELLAGFRFYDYAVDIFSAGCILAGFLLGREPFFRGKDNDDQLVRIALVLGTEGLHDFLRKYDISLNPQLLEKLGTHRRQPWGEIEPEVGSRSSAEYCPEGLDLLDRMLCYDHQVRITASEALSHAFFDPVRREADSDASVRIDPPVC